MRSSSPLRQCALAIGALTLACAGCATRLPSSPAAAGSAGSTLATPAVDRVVSRGRPFTLREGADALRLSCGDDCFGAHPMWVGGADPAPAPSGAEESKQGGSLEQQVQNPLANLISVPFQLNANFNGGPEEDSTQLLLNIQPVIPVQLSSHWTLINRPILPVLWTEDDWIPGEPARGGVGDVIYQGYFSPKPCGKLTIGAGPVIQFPTASEEFYGTGKWSAGPGIVLVWEPTPKWTVGALASNVWSFAGDEDRADVSFLTVQPFISYQLGHGWNLSTSPLITADWEADSGEQWTVPVGGAFGRVMKLGCRHISWSVGGYYNVERAEGAPEWSLRFVFAFLFPK